MTWHANQSGRMAPAAARKGSRFRSGERLPDVFGYFEATKIARHVAALTQNGLRTPANRVAKAQ